MLGAGDVEVEGDQIRGGDGAVGDIRVGEARHTPDRLDQPELPGGCPAGGAREPAQVVQHRTGAGLEEPGEEHPLVRPQLPVPLRSQAALAQPLDVRGRVVHAHRQGPLGLALIVEQPDEEVPAGDAAGGPVRRRGRVRDPSGGQVPPGPLDRLALPAAPAGEPPVRRGGAPRDRSRTATDRSGDGLPIERHRPSCMPGSGRATLIHDHTDGGRHIRTGSHSAHRPGTGEVTP